MLLRSPPSPAPLHGPWPQPQFAAADSVSTLAFAQCGPQ